jgi:3-dehydroquinate synthase
VRELQLNLPQAKCRIIVGRGALRRLPGLLRSTFGSGRCVVVADRNARRYGPPGRALILPPGERTKSPGRLVRLWNEFAARGVDRHTPVVAVGGGVAGDLSGFAAATYMRGVPLALVPTTFLAQVDAAIGGKTAVNLPAGKNLAGTFTQPRLVVIDPDALRTLPEREYRTGLAEAVKYGMIRDRELFERIESGAEQLAARDLALAEEIIVRCVSIKAGIVRRDERERGPRMILNYGHTIGHAIERATDYRLNHGEAIAIGMNLEAGMAVELGLCAEGVRGRQNDLLERLGLPLRGRFSPARAAAAMALDKKARSGRVRFVLPRSIGRVRFPVPVPPELIRRTLLSSQA